MIDLAMWTRNGEVTLPAALESIEQAIPASMVAHRFLVDDGSSDGTVQIAERYGWIILRNEGNGISDAANTALKHVTSPLFVSVEQDLVLCREWHMMVLPLVQGRVAVASGVRLPDKPVYLRKLQEYATERYERETRRNMMFPCAKTIDNTCYNTEVLRGIGGFPEHGNVGVDTALVQELKNKGYEWQVNFKAVSTHLRSGLLGELRHNYWYGKEAATAAGALKRFLFSPARGLQMALAKRCWQLAFVYPLTRLAILLGAMS